MQLKHTRNYIVDLHSTRSEGQSLILSNLPIVTELGGVQEAGHLLFLVMSAHWNFRNRFDFFLRKQPVHNPSVNLNPSYQFKSHTEAQGNVNCIFLMLSKPVCVRCPLEHWRSPGISPEGQSRLIKNHLVLAFVEAIITRIFNCGSLGDNWVQQRNNLGEVFRHKGRADPGRPGL